MLPFFPRDVLDEIWGFIKSVSEGFPTYSFSFVRIAVACSILERASAFEPLSDTTAQGYLKPVSP